MAGDSGRVSAARLALSTGSLYSWALERVFGLAAEAGYDGMELLVDARMDSYDVPYLRRLSERSGMPILSVHTPFAERVEGWPDVPEQRVRRTVELAEVLGARTVVAHAPLRWQVGRIQLSIGRRQCRRLLVMPWHSAAGARYARWLLEDLPTLQAKTGVRVAVENMPAHRAWGRQMQLHRFSSAEELKQFPYLVLDTTHWGTCGVDPVAVYRALRERIVHVHLSNYDGREHRMPFKGHLALDALLDDMGRTGFSGLVVVETEPRAVAGGNWSEDHVRATLAQCAAQVRAVLSVASSHSHSNECRAPQQVQSNRAS